jgi:hypothetical protein
MMDWIKEHMGIVVVSVILLLVFASIGGVAIVAMSVQDDTPTATPTIIPTLDANVTATPTITPTPIPELNNSTMPGYTINYKEYIGWLYEYYGYNATPSTVPVFVNPESYEAYLNWLNQTQGDVSPGNPNYVPGHPETSNGSIIFVPTPTPSPTPTPIPSINPRSREVHKIVDNVNIEIPPDREGKIANVLAWDQEHTTGLYDYYSPGDHAVIIPRFVNNYCPQNITDPTITATLSKNVLGQWVVIASYAWVEHVTIPGAPVDQYEGRLLSELPAFTTVYEFDVPDKWQTQFGKIDTAGYYLLEIQVDVPWYKQACWFSKQVKILD